MTALGKPISFVATSEPEAALVFYRDVLGLEFVETSPYALVFADAGQMLRVQVVAGFEPAGHTAHGWDVVDIAPQMAALAAAGVGFLRFAHMGQDAQGVWTSPDGHKIAWFKDPSGNVLSLTQFVPG